MHLEDHEGWRDSLELPVCLGVYLHKGQGHFTSFWGFNLQHWITEDMTNSPPDFIIYK